MRKSAPKETVEPAAQPPTIKDVLQKKREVKKASEDAIAALKKRAEEEIAKIRQETEAKLVEAEKNVTAETTKVSAEIAEQFKALKKEIAVADEVISSETETIKPSRIILKIKGKYRLYGVNAGLIGVFRTKEEAIKRGKK
jgi:F0F1-type ATP synthase membrane subunit b/b'